MNQLKGIILAGGSGTRLYPVTTVVNKQLIPIYDKPMIYYPLSVLMLSGIREVLIISSPFDISQFECLLGNGSQWGMRFEYKEQDNPNGLAEAFIIGKKFIGSDNVCLILGDNIFYGQGFQQKLIQASKIKNGATIFGYWVGDPTKYGVIEFDKELNVLDIEEKPEHPKSNYVVPGLYFYDNQVIDIAEQIEPSDRGELEITDVNRVYLTNKQLKVLLLGRGFAWLDTGTHSSLLEASRYVETIEKRQGLKIACLEEVAYRMGFIDAAQVEKQAQLFMNSGYGQYLINMLNYEILGVETPKENECWS
jgi:glucose-1-phosphate thymidylyltransferase